MASLSLDNAQQRCLKTYLEMTDELRIIATDFDNKFADLAAADLLGTYDRGQMIDRALANEPDAAQALRKLARVTRRSVPVLEAMRKLAKAYTRDAVEKIAWRRCSYGQHLTSTHLLIVANLASAAERERRLEAMFADPPSARALARELKALGLDETTTARRRRPQSEGRSSPTRGVDEVPLATSADADRKVDLPSVPTPSPAPADSVDCTDEESDFDFPIEDRDDDRDDDPCDFDFPIDDREDADDVTDETSAS